VVVNRLESVAHTKEKGDGHNAVAEIDEGLAVAKAGPEVFALVVRESQRAVRLGAILRFGDLLLLVCEIFGCAFRIDVVVIRRVVEGVEIAVARGRG
jgi:hypothetical protein